MSTTIWWIIAAVVVVGLFIWLLKAGGKKGSGTPKAPEGPSTPPPPETPGM
jgi:hypothetical protein